MSEREHGMQRPGTERLGRPAVRSNLGTFVTVGRFVTGGGDARLLAR
jgi:hypothetical protein